jgi:hypothetical protein
MNGVWERKPSLRFLRWGMPALAALALISGARCAFAQEADAPFALPLNTNPSAAISLLADGDPQPTDAPQASVQNATQNPAQQSTDQNATPPPQPKRILGVMPNFRAVSAGTTPPPPTAKQRLWTATQNSFDYSAFIFVGITSLLAEGTNAHRDLGKGLDGYWNYYWRGFVDKADGNYWVIFVLPTIFRQDERYYAMGKGGFWKRGFYSATRIFVTPDDHGHPSFNASELLGRAIAQGISTTYYPPADRTIGSLADKYAFALGRDALTNVFREFWPDIATHVLHRHP